jgi:ribosome-binding factor A
MASDRRRQQVAQRIRQKVSELLLFEVKDPRASFVTVTSVDVTRDLAVAKVRWSVLEDKHRSRVEHMLEHARGFFRTEVARDLQLRTAPELRFEYDRGIAQAARIEQVLREVLPAEDPDGSDESDDDAEGADGQPPAPPA